jgi:hypothetical protein
VTLHRGPVLLPSMLDVGLPQQVDHYPGTGSPEHRPHAHATQSLRSGGRFIHAHNANVAARNG